MHPLLGRLGLALGDRGRLAVCGAALWLGHAAPAWSQLGPSAPPASNAPDVPATAADTTLPNITARAKAMAAAAKAEPHHVTVITAKDIARSTATTVSDLLSAQGNLSLQSYFGNDKNAGIDMRGMGATAGSNVLIIVDGVRLNANDLSGADLSTLSLSQVERIEIVRGGGAVREGSGAVGGVIRITTRRSVADGTLSTNLQGRVGAYGSRAWDLNSTAQIGSVGAAVQLSRNESDGYRDNSGFDAKNAALELRWSPTLGSVSADVSVKASKHRDRYGLPGPVSKEAFHGDSAARRSTQKPLDGGSTDVDRYDMSVVLDAGQPGRLTMRATHRDRRNPYFVGVDPDRPLSDQQNRTSSGQWDLHADYTLEGSVLGMNHTSSLGWDSMDGDYANSEQIDRPSGQVKSGDASSSAVYTESTLHLTENVAVNAGLRWNHFAIDRRLQSNQHECSYSASYPPVEICSAYTYRDSTPPLARKWFNRSAELGLNWQITPEWNSFASIGRTFRAPNLDELVEADANLRPQHGYTNEIGVHNKISTTLDWSATAFAMQNRAEIFYGQDLSGSNLTNRNYDNPTLRKGVELDANWQAASTLRMHGQLSRLSPKFEGTPGDIPLVARTTASTQLEWQPATAWRWTLTGRYVGTRLNGSATGNNLYAFDTLPAYTVWDSALRYALGTMQLTLGVNNLFNEIYTTVVYAGDYYPMPERNVYVALSWRL